MWPSLYITIITADMNSFYVFNAAGTDQTHLVPR